MSEQTIQLPLPIYPAKPTGAQLEMFKQAKAMIKTDILVQLVRAVNGSPGRVIALREHPEFLCDYAFVKEPSESSIQAAMRWALGDHEDARAVTIVSTLEKIFKGKVREVAVSKN